MSAFPGANNCQGQLKTPQSVPVLPSSIDVKNEWMYLYMPSWRGQRQLLPLWYGNDLEHSQIIFSFNTASFPKVVGGAELISSDLVFLLCAHVFSHFSTAVIQRKLAFSQPWNKPADFTQVSQTFLLYRVACISTRS